MKGTLKHIIAAAFCLCLCGCGWFGRETPAEDRTYDKVMILYSAGFNSLSSYLAEDIEDLTTGWLPSKNDSKAIVVVSHRTRNNGSLYVPSTNPCVIRIYKDKKNIPVMDTLLTLGTDMLLSKPEVMDSTLNYIRHNFRSDHYGMIMSSHATGWLPKGYYASPTDPTGTIWSSAKKAPARTDVPRGAVPYVEEVLPGPAVKSFGQEIEQVGKDKNSYELDLPELVDAIPMHLDYLLFDACLMGCVEVAYEFRDKCDYLAFSPTEILADGLDYPLITQRLLVSATPDLRQVCEDYYNLYKDKSGDFQSATISLIDCRRLDALASVCADIIEAHPLVRAGSKAAEKIDAGLVQPYFRSDKHWFYDLEDIFAKGGMTDSEAARLRNALDACVLYSAHTQYFISFPIDTYCGFSMYLPCKGGPNLDAFYKSLAWNRAVRLVR